jgi:hypothetical protein
MFGTVDFESVLAFGECSICKDEMLEKPSLAHKGKCEPFHEDCLKTWIKINNICPKCHATVDVNSLFSWKERAIIQLKKELILIKEDMFVGAIIGSSLLGAALLCEALNVMGKAIPSDIAFPCLSCLLGLKFGLITVGAMEVGVAKIAATAVVAGGAAAAATGAAVEKILERIAVGAIYIIGAALAAGYGAGGVGRTVAKVSSVLVGILAAEAAVKEGTIGAVAIAVAITVGAIGGAAGGGAFGIIQRRYFD